MLRTTASKPPSSPSAEARGSCRKVSDQAHTIHELQTPATQGKKRGGGGGEGDGHGGSLAKKIWSHALAASFGKRRVQVARQYNRTRARARSGCVHRSWIPSIR